MAFRRQFSDQLPKWQPWTPERVLALAGSIAGLLALFITFFKIDQLAAEQQILIFAAELGLLCIGLIIYIYVMTRKKLHRYAQATYFMHYTNHVIRDQIASMEAGKEIVLRELLQDIVDACANCFSLLGGKRCRCSIIEVRPNNEVAAVVRDRLTSTQSPHTHAVSHTIDENTDFSNIWYGTNGCPRYFPSRNLIKLWQAGRYKNSSFKLHGEPSTVSVLGMTCVSNWPLPYKSTIVWPIRYIPEGTKWPLAQGTEPAAQGVFLWGFLCIDCGSKRVFDTIHAPELGAAFADALFSVLHTARMMMADQPVGDGPANPDGPIPLTSRNRRTTAR